MRRRNRLSKQSHLSIEVLDSRRVLATAVWDGGGDDGRWTNPQNWVGDNAPSPGDHLWFVGAAARKSNFNTFPAGTNFGSINFAAGGYQITGRTIDITGTITALNASGDNTIDAPIRFTAAGTINSTFAGTNLALKSAVILGGTLTVTGSGNTSLDGAVAGAAGIVKNGPGTLLLAGDNLYTGLTTINAGVVSTFGFGNPLGDESVGTVVKSGATLQTTHINDNMAEPLTLNGYGVLGDVLGSTRGALQIGPPAFTTWTGPITLGSDASIGVEHTGNLTITTNPVRLNGHKLTINGMGPTLITSPIIDGTTAGGSLAINTALVRGTEYGTVTSTAVNTYTGTTLINSGVLNLSGNGSLASTDIQIKAAPGTPSFGSNGFPIAGGVLRLDNTDVLKANRIPDSATITFEGGSLQYLGLNAATLSTEKIGSLNFAAGQSYVQSLVGAADGSSNRLNIGSLTRSIGATVDFSGIGLGTTRNKIVFTQAPTKVGSNGGILPYATYTGANQDFATYSGALGIGPFTGYVTNLAAAGASDIVLLTGSQTLGIDKTITGLMVRDGGTNTTLTLSSNKTFRVTRALLTTSTSTSSNKVTIAPTDGSSARLVFGAEGIVHRNTPTLIKAAIGGATTLVLSGTAPLEFEPPSTGNDYTGGTILNSGEFTLNNENSPLGDAEAPLELRGGVFGLSVFITPTVIPNPLVLDNANAHFKAISDISFTGPITLTGRNIVAVPGNVTVDFVGKVTGTGSLIATASHNSGAGGGTLILSNPNNDYSGGTILVNQGIFDSTLQLNHPNVLGTGPVLISGGNLTAGAPLTLTKPLSLASSTVTFGGLNRIKLAGSISMIGINNLGRDFSGGPPVIISGLIRGTGAITKTGDHVLTFTRDNTYTGSTLIKEGTLVINGVQRSSDVGIVKSGSVVTRLSGTGSVGFISAAAGGIVDPGTHSAFGSLAAKGANFSDGGVLRLRVGNNTTALDFDSLDLGTGMLIVGPRSPLQIDLKGLTSPRNVANLVEYGSRLGVINRFSTVIEINNPNEFEATATYTSTAMSVSIGAGSSSSDMSESQLASDAVFSELGDEYDAKGRTRKSKTR